MAAFVIQNQITNTEDLQNFDGLGYKFDNSRSNMNSLVFIR